MRTKKTIGSTVTYYIVDGGKIISQKTGTASMYFDYSADGNPFHMSYNGRFYYFVLNGQGDVIALLDSSGNTVVEYTYDPWGKVLSVTGTLAGTLGQANPIRYRGYYYDSETGFYYLQSRYYDPETGRFISSDGYLSTGQDILGNNMFAYCGNNPVNRSDPSGEFALSLVGGLLAVLGVTAGTFIIAVNATTPGGQKANSEIGKSIYRAASGVVAAGSEFAKSFVKDYNIGKSNSRSKEKTATKTAPEKKQAYFTIDPYNFNPKGLIMREFPGTNNGRIIEWRDPISNTKIFEWNEDLKNGAHYHAMMIEWDGNHQGTHYKPNDPVPEPWNSIYFGG